MPGSPQPHFHCSVRDPAGPPSTVHTRGEQRTTAFTVVCDGETTVSLARARGCDSNEPNLTAGAAIPQGAPRDAREHCRDATVDPETRSLGRAVRGNGRRWVQRAADARRDATVLPPAQEPATARTPWHEASRHNIRNPRKDCRPDRLHPRPSMPDDRLRGGSLANDGDGGAAIIAHLRCASCAGMTVGERRNTGAIPTTRVRESERVLHAGP